MSEANENKKAYIALRHFNPDMVRLMRAALDLGMKVETIRNGIKKHGKTTDVVQLGLDALDYLIANPQAGVVTWVEGERWEFADRIQQKQETA